MDFSDNFIKQKGGEVFQGKLTRYTTAKASLTKALRGFQKTVEEFVGAESQPIITRKRKANQVMEGVKKMELRMENLGKYIEDFTNYVAELGE